MEKKSFTQEMSWLHTWSGLIFGWLLVPIFVTGAICVFWFEISVWARPEVHAMRVADPADLVEFSEAYLKKAAPDSRLWRITFPATDHRDPILTLNWLEPDGKLAKRTFVPDGSGAPVVTSTIGGRFFVNFHYALNILPRETNPVGLLLVGLASIAFLVGVVGGVVVHKRIFKDFFTFRPKAKSRQRTWLDAHNVLSVLPLPFHFLIVFTGLLFFCYAYVPSGIATLFQGSESAFLTSAATSRNSEYGDLSRTEPGTPATGMPLRTLYDSALPGLAPEPMGYIVVRDPGRNNAAVEFFGTHHHGIYIVNTPRVALDGSSGEIVRVMQGRPPVGTAWDTAAGLHMVFFGGIPMRVLYLVGGMAGAIMMATGQLLFTIKRREKTVSPSKERFFTVVDKINVATIAGVCFACVAHLWAIRLLPYGMADRPIWEVRMFFVAWALAFAHAALRPTRTAWTEQLAATAMLCLGLPVLGFLVPHSNLFEMIARGDWKTAGVDLSSVGFGIVLAMLARIVSGKRATQSLHKPSLIPA